MEKRQWAGAIPFRRSPARAGRDRRGRTGLDDLEQALLRRHAARAAQRHARLGSGLAHDARDFHRPRDRHSSPATVCRPCVGGSLLADGTISWTCRRPRPTAASRRSCRCWNPNCPFRSANSDWRCGEASFKTRASPGLARCITTAGCSHCRRSPSASGARFTDTGVEFWNKGDRATIHEIEDQRFEDCIKDPGRDRLKPAASERPYDDVSLRERR